jgi:hypothetical protein
MHETVLLRDALGDGQVQVDGTSFEGRHLGAQQGAEGLRGQDGSG